MRAAIVKEAREWLQTPYKHQARLKGVGCDCVGLIRGVGESVGAMPIDPAAWARFDGYGRLPNPRRMLEGMQTFLTPCPGKPDIGDIVWLQWRDDLPMHLAIIGRDVRGGLSLIHSFSDAGRVVEHSFSPEWLARVSSYWSYPNLCGVAYV